MFDHEGNETSSLKKFESYFMNQVVDLKNSTLFFHMKLKNLVKEDFLKTKNTVFLSKNSVSITETKSYISPVLQSLNCKNSN